jgi:Uma2 family endonuclease
MISQRSIHFIAHSDMTRAVETTDRPITGEELLRMTDVGRCELVKGQIKGMPPATGHSHGRLKFQIAKGLDRSIEEEAGEVMVGEVGIYTERNPDSVRAADVLFISRERLDQVRSDSFLDVAPELVVEIMSPENKWEEMREKLEEYLDIGVDTIWVVEPSNRAVQVYRGIDEVQTLDENDVLEGDGLLEGFSVAVADLFDG